MIKKITYMHVILALPLTYLFYKIALEVWCIAYGIIY
jgi:hypothetical protein